jgi:hypothetical protein
MALRCAGGRDTGLVLQNLNKMLFPGRLRKFLSVFADIAMFSVVYLLICQAKILDFRPCQWTADCMTIYTNDAETLPTSSTCFYFFLSHQTTSISGSTKIKVPATNIMHKNRGHSQLKVDYLPVCPILIFHQRKYLHLT